MQPIIKPSSEAFGRREENLATAERLLAAEKARLIGTQGYTVEQFKTNLKYAIKQETGKQVFIRMEEQ